MGLPVLHWVYGIVWGFWFGDYCWRPAKARAQFCWGCFNRIKDKRRPNKWCIMIAACICKGLNRCTHVTMLLSYCFMSCDTILLVHVDTTTSLWFILCQLIGPYPQNLYNRHKRSPFEGFKIFSRNELEVHPFSSSI